ncbi:LacI family DNA-binding transcriptional regulator [Salegentibacter maritimus]|uniref:LacI family DNA-binding transcriptional regulator n=1 Tax=Salegentibacter maritimus TaxID=2794347 RepID=A0ABS0TJL8_9FLAO|nr:LacI family DNA-binding transcriptional regulator [Salegentibacter maritimus]MBI6121236.1 LacI family DNA-binding transcriptional regulator [Salegentibacter maritimus]
MKKIYLKDIAKHLNVSKTAVSLVLNNKGDENKISLATQKRIKEYAKKHNYEPNQLARSLSTGKSKNIGLIIPDISDTFYAKIASRVENMSEKLGYTVLFSSSNENPNKETKLIQSLLNRQVEGLIIASTQQNQKDIQILKTKNMPFVLIDRYYPNYDTNYVIVDNYGGVNDAVKHLWDLGRRKIGFISLKPGLEAMRQRLMGYRDAMKDFGVDTDDVIKELSYNNYENEIKNAIEELVRHPNNVDSIMFSTHYLAALGLRELRSLNIKVPDDVAIISFDEMGAFDLVDPPITSVLQPVSDIGGFAVKILMQEIEGKSVEIEKRMVLDTELIVRRSCGAS